MYAALYSDLPGGFLSMTLSAQRSIAYSMLTLLHFTQSPKREYLAIAIHEMTVL